MMEDVQHTQAPLLHVAGLSFSYPQRHVFTHWSHDFSGGLTWIRGSNGSGKSTLLKLLAGALAPLTGSIAAQGIDIQSQPLHYRRQVFWCGPGPVVFDHLTPTEYFGFMASLYAQRDGHALARHVEGFELGPFVHSPLATLSTGTQRKVWLAMALSAGTSVTLLDEPLNALDARSSAHLRASLAQAAQDPGRAWLVASHEDLGAATAQARLLDLELIRK